MTSQISRAPPSIEIGFVGLCSSRAATARLMTWIERRTASGTAPVAMARGVGS